MSRALIVIGLVLVAAGVLWPFIGRLGLGRLPGDVYIQRPNFAFYFPIMTSLIISILVSIILWLVHR
jgi:Protein of unknown function (DUF2905)